MFVSLASLIVLAHGCGSSSGPADAGPTGGPVAGAEDQHCTLPDAGVEAQAVDLSTCHAAVDAGTPDYGPTLYNSEANDDDCKYHVKFTATPIRENANVTFTVTANTLADGHPATGANVLAEVFLSDTHPAPNSGQQTTEKAGGILRHWAYQVRCPGSVDRAIPSPRGLPGLDRGLTARSRSFLHRRPLKGECCR